MRLCALQITIVFHGSFFLKYINNRHCPSSAESFDNRIKAVIAGTRKKSKVDQNRR